MRMKNSRIYKLLSFELKHLRERLTDYIMDFFDDPIYSNAECVNGSIPAQVLLRPAAFLSYLEYLTEVIYSWLMSTIKQVVNLLCHRLERAIAINMDTVWKYKIESVKIACFKGEQTAFK